MGSCEGVFNHFAVIWGSTRGLIVPHSHFHKFFPVLSLLASKLQEALATLQHPQVLHVCIALVNVSEIWEVGAVQFWAEKHYSATVLSKTRDSEVLLLSSKLEFQSLSLTSNDVESLAEVSSTDAWKTLGLSNQEDRLISMPP